MKKIQCQIKYINIYNKKYVHALQNNNIHEISELSTQAFYYNYLYFVLITLPSSLHGSLLIVRFQTLLLNQAVLASHLFLYFFISSSVNVIHHLQPHSCSSYFVLHCPQEQLLIFMFSCNMSYSVPLSLLDCIEKFSVYKNKSLVNK